MDAEFLFLGTGGSSGVPMVGCTCSVCTSSDFHNKRLRPSALITFNGKKILIDSGPDLRYQALHFHIDDLDGVILTHSHFDHVAGLDELRIYYLMHRKRLSVLVAEPTYQDLKSRYDYLFREKSWGASLTAQLDFQVIGELRGKTEFLGLPIGFMRFDQGGMPVTGYRFGSLAYLSDIRNYPDSIFEDLSGVKVLIVSAISDKPSLMHFSIDEAVAFATKVGAEKVYFTHMGHELDYAKTNAYLPENIRLGYDGLKVVFNYEYI